MIAEDLPSPPESSAIGRLLVEGAKNGDPVACRQLAGCYKHGTGGLPLDPALALQWLRVSAWAGHPGPIRELLIALNDAAGLPEREHWLGVLEQVADDRSRSDEDRASAVLLLAEHRMDRQRELLDRAIELGSVQALVPKGDLLQASDPVQARALFQRATAHDDGWGRLGHALETGLGGPVDMAEAVRCYERGVQKNDPLSSLYLGLCLIEGRGVPRDLARARVVLSRAATAGDNNSARAQRLLDDLER